MKEKTNNDVKNKSKITIGIVVLFIFVAILLFFLFNGKAQYEVSFDSNGGSAVASIIVDKNGLAIKPEDPTKENHVFAGWYYNDELFDFSKPITENIKLEARWVEIGRVAGVKLEQKDLTLKIGDKLKLNAIITPEDALDKTVTWESSDDSIVKVDDNGNVEALKEGVATITVTTKDGEFTAKVEISVSKEEEKEDSKNEPESKPEDKPTKPEEKPVQPENKPTEPEEKPTEPEEKPVEPENKPTEPEDKPTEPEVIKVTGISLDKTKLNLYINESTKLTATIKPNNASNKGVTWKSSNSNVASVDTNGNVKALSEGTATITVTTADGNYTASCEVVVSKKPDNYAITFTGEALYPDGPKVQCSVAVTKNGSPCNYKFIIYNGEKIGKNPDIGYFNTSIKNATIRLSDGTDVTATVNYVNF